MGAIVLVSGFSGAGKGTIIRRALLEVPEYRMGRSVTTRPYRPGDEAMYDNVSEADFTAALEKGDLLESNQHFDAWYGKRVPSDDGPWVYEVDVEGAEEIRKQLPHAVKVFILPPEPTIENLRRRILERAERLGDPISDEQVDKRLGRVPHEIEFSRAHGPVFEIINDDLKVSVPLLVTFLRQQLAAHQ